MEPEGLVVGGRITPHWMRDGRSFWYTGGTPDNPVIFRVDGVTGKVTPHALEPTEASARASAAPRSFWRTKYLMEPRQADEVPSADGCWFASVEEGNIVLRKLG